MVISLGAGISDADRAWAENQKPQLLIDRGANTSTRDDCLKIRCGSTPTRSPRLRLVIVWVCALGRPEKSTSAGALITAARATFNGQHRLDAAAALALGNIAQEKNDPAKAIAMFDAAVAETPDAATSLQAHLARAMTLLQSHSDDAALADLQAATELARFASQAAKDSAIATLRQAANALAMRENYQSAVGVLSLERTLNANPPADFYARLASVSEKRAEQVEQSAADANGSERVRRLQPAREFRLESADAWLNNSRSLATAGDKKIDRGLLEGHRFARIGRRPSRDGFRTRTLRHRASRRSARP